MKNKKILLISHDLAIAGASMSLMAIAKILKEKYQVEVWSLCDGPLKKEYKKSKISCKIVNNIDFKVLSSFLHDYNLIIINTVIPNKFADYCQKNKLPHIWLIREATNIPEFYDRTEDLAATIKGNKNIYATSEYAKEYIDKEFSTNVGVLHNFIPDIKQKIGKQLKKTESKKLQFSLVGYFTPRKGLHVCIEAIEALSIDLKNQITFNIVGNRTESTKDYWEPLYNKTQKLDVYNWTGEIWGDDKWRLFLETDVFVVPSFDESCSRVVLEAMMLGKPVIISQNVGAKYMVNDQTGWIVKTGCVNSLKECLENIIENNKDKLVQMGNEARKIYLETSTEEIYKEKLIRIVKNHINDEIQYSLLRELKNTFFNLILSLKLIWCKIRKANMFEKIFSVKNRESNNHTWYKVIRILGIKISLKNKTLTLKKNYEKLKTEHEILLKKHKNVSDEYENYKLEQAGLKKQKDSIRGQVYNNPVDLQKEEPRTYFYHWIKPNSKVLDVGCACGDMGEILYKDKQCVITGLEYNDCSVEVALETGAYKNVIQCDLNKYEHIQINDKYDYIIMGDILEHLYNPQEVLKYFMQYLNDDGSILISLPNVGHASIKANLLMNNFDYTKTGLLDNTHIRFFTYKTALELINNLGLCLNECELTRFVGPLGFQKTNPYPELSEEIKKAILEDKNSSIVQFVFKCKRGEMENVAEKNSAIFYAELEKMDYMQDIEKYITKNS